MATVFKSDEQLQKDVLAELKWDARVLPNEIGVVVKDGVVTLTGWVDSYTKRWAAEEAARKVLGVKAVANDIEVRLPMSDQRTDGDLAAAALRALQWDAAVPDDRIQVTVSNGWVTLKGEVEWQFQRQDAERAVQRLTGVKGVTNLISVKPRVTASELKQKIEQALLRSVTSDVQRISVEVEGSKVVLKGTGPALGTATALGTARARALRLVRAPMVSRRGRIPSLILPRQAQTGAHAAGGGFTWR